tara:strand:+ start:1303 stop:1689 length:387 start_codon:yes stop_codon:yes gene_type:complete
MAIKRTKWDSVFSNLIRYRDDWTCQRCSKKYAEGSQGLHCSHFFGRRSWATRLEEANAMALCYSCHIYIGSNPIEHVQLWESKFTKKEQLRIKDIHFRKLIKKRDIANDTTYQKLKARLAELKLNGCH